MVKIESSEITPKHLYLSRRDFLKAAGIVVGGAAFLAACKGENPEGVLEEIILTETPLTNEGGEPVTEVPSTPSKTDELGDALTSYDGVSSYNNYYEFTTNKKRVAELAAGFRSSPWEVEVGGLVSNPGIYDIDTLRNDFEQEERIYRMRCVEGWSMVIPWMGFPLRKLIDKVEPISEAKFLRFETLFDPLRFPNQKTGWYPWPYVEGLRIDEAMNDLTVLATGIYGEHLLPQNGAPIRLVVPWKYGFKSIKSIVKIEFVDYMPHSLWMQLAPQEYGFYANVNPEVDHPRWSQSSERRIGELGRRETLMFNGYEEQVATLYEGMDLRKKY
jgi:sulfoxide reductase catalytic subunit YedY